ncbi:MAG: hypothetical protein ACPGWR_02510 [Ardenticatenaceae bacterium]
MGEWESGRVGELRGTGGNLGHPEQSEGSGAKEWHADDAPRKRAVQI